MITADLKEVLNVEPKILIHPAPFALESGIVLPELKIEYRAFGRLNAAGDNVLWVCHALTASAEVQSWWPGFVGPGFIYDPEHYFIVCANILGSCYGTSGPIEVNPETSKPYFSDFPQITIRDMVKAHEVLRAHLGIKSIHTCIGGSLGGQQALEWAIEKPSLIKHLVLMATNAFHSPWGIAFNEAQRMALIADPTYKDHHLKAGQAGLRAARAMALLSYRSYETYNLTQKEEDAQKTDHYKASSYQQYQGDKLVNRFHAHSYWILSKAMDSHHIGRGRSSVEAALATVQSRTLVVAISSDVLFPPCEQQLLAEHIPAAQYQEIESMYGHDGFLIEAQKISQLLREFYQA